MNSRNKKTSKKVREKIQLSPPEKFPYNISMNPDALEYLKSVEQNEIIFQKKKKRQEQITKRFQKGTALEIQVQKQEKKINEDLKKIIELEKMIELENLHWKKSSKRIHSAYMSQAKYDHDQSKLKQIFLDDRAHPRTTVPIPTKYPKSNNTPNISDQEDSM